MRAIVTGGAGFIGCHLAERLVAEGHEVLVLDNLSSGFLHNVPKGARMCWADLSHEDGCKRIPWDGADAIFHLASHVGQELSFERSGYDFRTNGLATMFLLEWARKHVVPTFVFASSMNLYGHSKVEFVDETMPVDPPSPYAVGKLASENLLTIENRVSGMKAVSLRLFNIYGPRQDMQNMKQGMVSIFSEFVARNEPVGVRGPGERFRDFVYVDDAVDAFVRSLDAPDGHSVYNVATGKKTTVRELVSAIVASYGHDPETYPVTFGDPTPQDQFGLYGDASKINAELGWKAGTSLADGLAVMSPWVSRHGNL